MAQNPVLNTTKIVSNETGEEIIPERIYHSDKDIVLTDTTWDDLRFPLIGNRLDSASGRIDYNYIECTVDFDINARYPEEPICFVAQMPHSKKIGTVIRPHIHWVQEQNQVPNWLFSYRVYNNGDPVPTFTNVAYSQSLFPYTSGSIMQLTLFPDIILPSPENVSAGCDMILYRDSANASGLFSGLDPYTIIAKAKEVDIHFEIDSLGSSQEFTK